MTAQRPTCDPIGIIEEGCRILGVEIRPVEAAAMGRYIGLLTEWSARTNLTSLKDPVDIAISHFLDSLTVFKVLPRGDGPRVVDVGSGAGFPGLVMKIADESLHVTLLDQNPKKIVFVKEVARELGLAGVAFLNRKLETVLEDSEMCDFDVAVSRALSSEPVFFERLRFLLAPHGLLVRMAGPASSGEELVLAHFRKSAEWEGTLPFSDSFRRVYLYERIG